MNKRGTLGVVVGAAILLFFLAVVFIVILCPNCVFSKVASASDRVSDSILGGIRKERLEKTTLQVDRLVKEIYEDIKKNLFDEGTGPCVLNHIPFVEDFKGHIISCMLDQSIDNLLLFRCEIFKLIDNKKETFSRKFFASRYH